MTKWQAIALARAKYAEHPGTFLKLTPYRLWNGQWAVACQLTPLVAWTVTDPATFDSDLQAILAAGRRWNLEDARRSHASTTFAKFRKLHVSPPTTVTPTRALSLWGDYHSIRSRYLVDATTLVKLVTGCFDTISVGWRLSEVQGPGRFVLGYDRRPMSGRDSSILRTQNDIRQKPAPPTRTEHTSEVMRYGRSNSFVSGN